MKDTVKEMYEFLQANKNVRVYGVFSLNKVDWTVYCALYTSVNRHERLITKAGHSCSHGSMHEFAKEKALITTLVQLADFLDKQVIVHGGVSLKDLYFNPQANIADLIQANMLYVTNSKTGEVIVKPNQSKIFLMQQVERLFEVMGYSLRFKRTPVNLSYVLSKIQ